MSLSDKMPLGPLLGHTGGEQLRPKAAKVASMVDLTKNVSNVQIHSSLNPSIIAEKAFIHDSIRNAQSQCYIFPGKIRGNNYNFLEKSTLFENGSIQSRRRYIVQ